MSRSPLSDVAEAADEHTAVALLDAHAEQLAGAIERAGVDAAAGAAGVDSATMADAAENADLAGALDLEAVAAVLALDEGTPSAEDVVAAALEDLLFGMTAGVLDVEAVAGELALDLEPREVQGILEGRHPLTLREFAALQAVIVGRTA